MEGGRCAGGTRRTEGTSSSTGTAAHCLPGNGRAPLCARRGAAPGRGTAAAGAGGRSSAGVASPGRAPAPRVPSAAGCSWDKPRALAAPMLSCSPAGLPAAAQPGAPVRVPAGLLCRQPLRRLRAPGHVGAGQPQADDGTEPQRRLQEEQSSALVGANIYHCPGCAGRKDFLPQETVGLYPQLFPAEHHEFIFLPATL
ncbi:uncharacterized protein LOC131574794 [Poecile atricapillus]|uniref:uncharacterized protein LOC131574794 n=1 Tax=Poecile atricapillus TaxID=48891 RepID=UPI00273895CB|nr:uncharacterized protein LOC131574794 [Poecile atricapillus]